MESKRVKRPRIYPDKCLRSRYAACVLLAGIALAVQDAPAQTDQGATPAVPARFVREIALPGQGDSILRPSAIHFDAAHSEILVGDSGNNRVVFFNPQGTYRFEFRLGRNLASIRDITTDAEGYVYILGSVPGRLAVHRFDFDGLPLGEIALPSEFEGRPIHPRSLACSDEDRLYLLDEDATRILEFNVDGEIVASLALDSALGESDPSEVGFGPLTIANGAFLIPASTLGSVLRFALDGSPLAAIGSPGNIPGTLNFPVAVETGPSGMFLVIDKHRYCVVGYDAGGRYLGEFGGKGYRLGWFFHPSLLAVPAPDRVVVGQIFKNRIQVCALPTFMTEGAVRGAESRAQTDRSSASVSIAGSDPGDALQRRSVESLQQTDNRDGKGSPSQTTLVSHVEVTE